MSIFFLLVPVKDCGTVSYLFHILLGIVCCLFSYFPNPVSVIPLDVESPFLLLMA